MAERLRRQTANLMRYARAGSNPVANVQFVEKPLGHHPGPAHDAYFIYPMMVLNKPTCITLYFLCTRTTKSQPQQHRQNDVIFSRLTLCEEYGRQGVFKLRDAGSLIYTYTPTPNREPGTLRLRCFYPSVKQHAGRRRRPEADRACCATEGGRRELTLLDGAGAHVIKGAPPA